MFRRYDSLAARDQRIKRSLGEAGDLQLGPLLRYLDDSQGDFLESIKVLEDQATSARGACETASRLVNAYILVLGALAGKRVCEVQDLRVKDVLRATQCQMRFVIRIRGGKNFSRTGAVPWAVSPAIFELLHRLALVRKALNQQFLLRTSRGGTPSNDILAPVWRSLGTKFAVNDVRKRIESCRHLVSGAVSDDSSGCLQAYLGHSVKNARLFYEFDTDAKCADAASLLDHLLCQILLTEGDYVNALLDQAPESIGRQQLDDLVRKGWTSKFVAFTSISEATFRKLQANFKQFRQDRAVEDAFLSFQDTAPSGRPDLSLDALRSRYFSHADIPDGLVMSRSLLQRIKE